MSERARMILYGLAGIGLYLILGDLMGRFQDSFREVVAAYRDTHQPGYPQEAQKE